MLQTTTFIRRRMGWFPFYQLKSITSSPNSTLSDADHPLPPICICKSGMDEEPIGVVPDIGNVDLTDPKRKKPKQKKGGAGGGKRRNKPRFKLVRSEK